MRYERDLNRVSEYRLVKIDQLLITSETDGLENITHVSTGKG